MASQEAIRRSVRSWPWIVVASGAAAADRAAIWWLAVPRGSGVCPAVLPAPAGCAAGARVPVAVVWTLIIAGLYAANLAVATTRLRRHRWLLAGALLALLVVVVWGHRSVLYA